jgi:hypothetical protein
MVGVLTKYVPPKRQGASLGLHGVTLQKIVVTVDIVHIWFQSNVKENVKYLRMEVKLLAFLTAALLPTQKEPVIFFG